MNPGPQPSPDVLDTAAPDDAGDAATPVFRPTLPTLPTRPPAPARVAGAAAPVAATNRFDLLLDEARRQPAPVRTKAKRSWWRRRLRRSLFGLVLAGAIAGGTAGYRWWHEREQISAVPEFVEQLPSPTSYWTTFTARQQDADALEYRIQRSPGSDSIVIELTHGFGEQDGETLLMSSEGVWDFDRQSGALAPTPLAIADRWAFYEHDSALRTFSDVITDDLRPYTRLIASTELAGDARADALVRLELGLDLEAFADDDHEGFLRWTQGMAIGSEDGGPLDPSNTTPTTYELVLDVDADGLVWRLDMRQRDTTIFTIDLDELSDGPFVPPDPTP